MSSSPKKSRKTDPQMQARLPLTTMMVDVLMDRNIPVPPPQSIECLTVSQTAKKVKKTNIVRFQDIGFNIWSIQVVKDV